MSDYRAEENRKFNVCCIYDGESGFQKTAFGLTADLLNSGQQVVYLAGAAKSLAVQRYFASQASGNWVSRGQLVMKRPDAAAVSSLGRLPDFMAEASKKAGEAGFSGLTVLLDMGSLPNTVVSPDALTGLASALAPLNKATLVAAFDKTLFEAGFLLKILHLYPHIVLGGELYRNIYRKELPVMPDHRLASVLLETLLDAVEFSAKAADHLPSPAAADTPSPAGKPSSLRGVILLADDDPFNREVIGAEMVQAGYSVDQVSNGKEAVAAAKARRYNIIFMDCNMPEMDGYTATGLIREQSKDCYTPIVALTAADSAADHRRCILAGMDYLLSKASVAKDLEGILERMTDAVNMDSLNSVREVFDGDKNQLSNFLSSFEERAKVHVSSIKQAVASGDMETVRRSAHGLRGNSSTVGLRNIFLIGTRLEMMAEEGASAGMSVLVEQLEGELKVAVVFLDKYAAQ